FRLGLSATPERTDERGYEDTIGPIVFRRDITELAGQYLAEYDVQRLAVPLSAEERAEYEAAREVYRTFLRANAIRMSERDGWQRFLLLSSQSDAGRRAFLAYRKQKRLALAAPGKIALLIKLL